MIRINLLPQKKARRQVEIKGEQSVAIALLALVLACVGVYFFVHVPLADSVEAAKAANQRVEASIRKLKDETKDFDTIAAQKKAMQDRRDAIVALQDARAVPSWMMRELASILTKDHKPTMTPEMAELVKSDRNRAWTQNWDPKRVWVDTFEEHGGNFTIRGAAQSDVDFTQFALRLQASAFFADVQPVSVAQAQDGASKQLIYKFTLTGKVLY